MELNAYPNALQRPVGQSASYAAVVAAQTDHEKAMNERERVEMAARIVGELRHGDPGDPLLLKARRVVSNYLGAD